MTAVVTVESGAGRDLLPTATGARTWAVVRELLRPRRWLAVAALGTMVCATGVGLLTAPLLGHIVDVVVQGRAAGALTWPVVLLALVAVTGGLATALGLGLVARLGEGMLAALRERFVERVLGLPLERVERAGSGDLTARVTNDVSVIAKSVREALPELGRSALTIGLTLVGLTVLDWRFLLAALLAAPIQLYTVRWYLRRAPALYAAQRVAVGAQQQQLLDTVGGARTVRAFRLRGDHVHRVVRRSEAAVDLALRGIRLVTRFFARLNLAEFVGLSAVLATGFVLVGADAVSIGTATAAALYFHNLFNPINLVLALVDDAQAAGASLARLVGVADLPTESVAGAGGAHDTTGAGGAYNTTGAGGAHDTAGAGGGTDSGTAVVSGGAVESGGVVESDGARPAAATVKAAGVGHAYTPGHEVLREVDLDIGAGERIALVGASGAGKTTLAKLIAGIHRPAAGSISLGGVDLTDLGPAATRRTVALVSQEVHVFAGPLADDLRLARPEATDAELRDALGRVGALSWVDALPDGLFTVVGEGGHRLTVTQAQQLALVRLVLADPPIAILDEATAEAGSAGARELEAAADRALAGRTALVVAHRLTQAATADRVVVLDAGRVVETGTHDELVAAGGRYATLWSAWSATR
ncbi:ATP-binding cassette, subfamily C [Amycolatopsis arida]|uniref:ATP-binding cassette, subfamily C n=1 Tax=Amycolatopsis arida TaxID=587909 RepID=A0A1I5ZRS2_9PSEU|nr:ABC transporter ATP-binding protein [Amycolatopsis arida]TDX89319.1 ATP-binding cassette subfamily C protein [Amycolatopsis arida]SFQ59121.1 ATP-binding cassette, subfamily C [Amycolatopsis arida]